MVTKPIGMELTFRKVTVLSVAARKGLVGSRIYGSKLGSLRSRALQDVTSREFFSRPQTFVDDKWFAKVRQPCHNF